MSRKAAAASSRATATSFCFDALSDQVAAVLDVDDAIIDGEVIETHRI